MTRAREFWDGQARWNALVAILDSPEVRDPARAAEAFDRSGREAARYLARFVHPESRVIDLGCGIGRVLRPLAPHCREIVGVDLSGEMLRRAAEYLAGVPNARTLLTDGGSLRDLADGSADFLYSLLCFIHVDKRSAFRYFREIARVLAPGGFAFLQFEDIDDPEGLRRFVEVAERDDPLEFYSQAELCGLFGAAGLVATDLLRSGGYLYATAVRRSRPDWRAAFRDAVVVTGLSASGSFEGDRFEPLRPGALRVRIDVRQPGWFPASPIFALTPAGQGPYGPALFSADAHTPLRGPGQHVLELRWNGPEAPVELELDGAPAALLDVRRGSSADRERAALHAGLLPLGLRWEPSTLRDFPSYFASRPIQVRS